MEINWSELIWQGRLDGLGILWDAILINVATYWWFGPLMGLLIVAAGWKGVTKLAAYIARVFAHTHGSP